MRNLIFTKHLTALIPLLALGSSVTGQDTTNFPNLGEIISQDESFSKLIAKDTQIEVLSSGFIWSEGPVWVKDEDHPFGGFILFSDIPKNQVVRWDEGKGSRVWLEPSGYTGVADYGSEPGSNGLIIDEKGRLISCEHGDRRLSIMTTNGGKRTLVDHYEGKRLNSPNDVCFGKDGETLYFTDPPYGLPQRAEDPARELDFCGVFRLSPDGELTLLTKELARPNGLAFSPDYSILYVAQSDPKQAIITAYPVKEDGTLGDGKVLYDATPLLQEGSRGLPDGLKVDQAGNLWATGPGGILVLASDGTLLGRILTGELTSNVTWGNDGSVLYLTADTYLMRIKTLTKGAGW